jgi:WhiB family redox-sensing transcriptional regulator
MFLSTLPVIESIPLNPASLFKRAILPLMDHWDWQNEGSCIDMPSENFFHPDAERGESRRVRDMKAKAICTQCPVLSICREFALVGEEPYGVWGALSPEDRLEILNSKRVSNH